GATSRPPTLPSAAHVQTGDNITVRVTPSAGGATGSAVTSSAVTVQDTAPVVDSVSITPGSPTTNNVLTANVSSHDDDGETVTYAYQRFHDGNAITDAAPS